MSHSTVTRKHQTTIPRTVPVHPGTRALKGALASKRGKGMSIAQIRAAAAREPRGRKGPR
jgi:hypothetical protein